MSNDNESIAKQLSPSMEGQKDQFQTAEKEKSVDGEKTEFALHKLLETIKKQTSVPLKRSINPNFNNDNQSTAGKVSQNQSEQKNQEDSPQKTESPQKTQPLNENIQQTNSDQNAENNSDQKTYNNIPARTAFSLTKLNGSLDQNIDLSNMYNANLKKHLKKVEPNDLVNSRYLLHENLEQKDYQHILINRIIPFNARQNIITNVFLPRPQDDVAIFYQQVPQIYSPPVQFVQRIQPVYDPNSFSRQQTLQQKVDQLRSTARFNSVTQQSQQPNDNNYIQVTVKQPVQSQNSQANVENSLFGRFSTIFDQIIQ